MSQKKRTVLVWLILMASFLVFYSLFNNSDDPEKSQVKIGIGEMISRAEHGDFSEIKITGSQVIATAPDGKLFSAYCNDSKEELVRALRAKGVTYTEIEPPKPNPLWSVLGWLLPIVIFILALMWLMKRQAQGIGGQMTSFTQSGAKLSAKSEIKFKDVAGIDEAVEDVKDLVTYLQDPARYGRIGARVPKGVLLMGPPGTGKTLLARALAGEAGVPFFSISGSEFVEMYVGVGASRVRDLFDKARKHKPCIVFIDEIDGVGRHRGGGLGNSHDEREQTLNQILKEMDGFEPNSGVIVMAATNRPDILDSAMVRAGRFDRHVIVPAPDVKGREAILKVHARGKPFDPNVDFSIIARGTPGMVGADLEKLLNEAALLASKAGREAISQADIESAVEKVYLGPERKGMRLSDKERRIVAFHEAGHAAVGWFTPACDPVHKITIIPRGRALGVTLNLPEEDRHLQSKAELLAYVQMYLGGRAAEEVFLGSVTGGCSGDLEQATGTIQNMLMKLGMSEELGLRSLGIRSRMAVWESGVAEADFSDATRQTIDAEIKQISDQSYGAAKKLLEEKRDLIENMVAELLEKETLDETDLIRILGPRPKG